MRKEAKIYRTDNGLEIEVDGKTIATLSIAVPVQEEESQAENNEEQPSAPSEEQTAKPTSVTYTFDSGFAPDITHTRLTEPKSMWAVPHGLSEGKNSVHLPANAYVKDGVLNLIIKNETAKYGDTVCAFTTGYVYSKKAFGLGRVDIEANLAYARDIKNSIWLTTSAYVDSTMTLFPNLRQLIEGDFVEFSCPDTGEYNTSRGMWHWQENKQSTSQDKLPWVNLEAKQSLSGGSWWWTANGWYQWKLYPICRNGNRLKGATNKMYYFITNRERGEALNSNELTWIREDGVEGRGLDGNKYFVAENTDAIGKGADKSTFLDGKTKIAGWHKWSIILDNDRMTYLCDDKEFWHSPETLHLPDGITYNLIFATNHVSGAAFTGEHIMQVKSVTYTPKQKAEMAEIEPLNSELW